MALLQGKSVGFAMQKSRFRNAKPKLPFFFGTIFTKQERLLMLFYKSLILWKMLNSDNSSRMFLRVWNNIPTFAYIYNRLQFFLFFPEQDCFSAAQRGLQDVV